MLLGEPDGRVRKIDEVSLILDRNLHGSFTLRRVPHKCEISAVEPCFCVPGVGRNPSCAACAKLLLQLVLEPMDLKVTTHAQGASHAPNSWAVACAPIELGLLHRQTRR